MPRHPPLTLESLCQRVSACCACGRLVEYRREVARTKKKQYRDDTYWGRPVPGFGDPHARILIVGLAPAAHGANRTGRMFTGDGTDGAGSSDFLARALCATGLANQPTSQSRDDGWELHGAYLTAVARCAPPDNRPLPQELDNCRDFLVAELDLLADLTVIVALGKVSFDRLLRLLAERGAPLPRPRPKFAHGTLVQFADGRHPSLLASYHPSRQNTQTGRLTATMLEEIFRRALALTSA